MYGTGIRNESLPESRRKFLVWSCRPLGTCGGLGNRIVNIVAAFALAVLTDRAFMIDYPGSTPLELENFVRSPVIDWRMPPSFEHSPFSHGSRPLGINHYALPSEHTFEASRVYNQQVT